MLNELPEGNRPDPEEIQSVQERTLNRILGPYFLHTPKFASPFLERLHSIAKDPMLNKTASEQPTVVYDSVSSGLDTIFQVIDNTNPDEGFHSKICFLDKTDKRAISPFLILAARSMVNSELIIHLSPNRDIQLSSAMALQKFYLDKKLPSPPICMSTDKIQSLEFSPFQIKIPRILFSAYEETKGIARRMKKMERSVPLIIADSPKKTDLSLLKFLLSDDQITLFFDAEPGLQDQLPELLQQAIEQRQRKSETSKAPGERKSRSRKKPFEIFKKRTGLDLSTISAEDFERLLQPLSTGQRNLLIRLKNQGVTATYSSLADPKVPDIQKSRYTSSTFRHILERISEPSKHAPYKMFQKLTGIDIDKITAENEEEILRKLSDQQKELFRFLKSQGSSVSFRIISEHFGFKHHTSYRHRFIQMCMKIKYNQ